jgi:hypothetical protein
MKAGWTGGYKMSRSARTDQGHLQNPLKSLMKNFNGQKVNPSTPRPESLSLPFDKPFDKLKALSSIEGLKIPSKAEGSACPPVGRG